MAYSKNNQTMDFKWQLARKLDRLDLGSFAALEFYYRNMIIFGFIRAMDPEEKVQDDEKKPDRSIDTLISSIDSRINKLQDFDTTALLLGKSNLPEVQDFQKKTVSAYYEIDEVIYRCKLTDQVRVSGEEV